VGEILEYRSPKKHDEATSWIGMVVFLASWGMMFGAIFFAYGGLRARAASWPPAGVPLVPLGLPGVNTAVIAASSLAIHYGVVTVRRGSTAKLGPALLATFALGCVFLVLQLIVWNELYATGLRPDSGSYGSVFYGLTWIHAAHVGVGLAALLWLAIQAFRGKYSAARHLSIRLWAMYWHFVGAIWAIMFLTVYVL
jgi:cytochrome c oxidase subunit 3